ncbi:MAG: molybdopterin oxidoreductase [Hydrogenophilales bacterium CG_4_9_14_3_um_filter_59_35]|nr:MAG: molybdopterin oxidoreductase [Hydrogenophilales bacterium CG18_big_fil_WC_8_21_14_2_50_58_12]PIX99836.1 MAG: molybdopterin oxidoreductase [Hydrogenophilales bacterium CG_4_10_14_3_um_filter_58_23]PJB04379.1 MAG: molybdopterin oxidoreductase [Hydrogenophilales bacterium CG_4_9_14_3_um_filter_59_35]
MKENIFNPKISRRRFLQAAGAAGAVGAAGIGQLPGFSTIAKAQAKTEAGKSGETVITKSFCHQCPARCGIDVYTTDGRVHAVFGTLDNPLSEGKLCPKGHYGQYLLYDADRFKGPMKRTNPKKGRNEDPKFVPISWDEALDTVAKRMNDLREKNESHRFGLIFGRGWGATDVGVLQSLSKLYGSTNIGLGHSSMCSDGSEETKKILDGNHAYNAYDYANTNYMLVFGAGFLESFRPFTGNMRAWGVMRTKPAKTKVTFVDVHLNTGAASSDRALLIKPGTDGAMALAIAHVLLTENLWDKPFVGNFVDGVNRFKTGETVAAVFTDEDIRNRAQAKEEAAVKKAAADKVAAEKAAVEKAKTEAAHDKLIKAQVLAKGDPAAEKAIAEKIAKFEKEEAKKALSKETDRMQREALDKDKKPEPEIKAGQALFNQKWVLGLPEWWNAVLKDCTPEWAEKITTIPAKIIHDVAREFGTTHPAIAIFERGAHAHTNGTYSGMAIHSLNALVGSMFAEGGLCYQMKPPAGKWPVNLDDFMDDYAKAPERKKPRIDMAKTEKWPMVSNMLQEVAKNHNAAAPYKLDTCMFYMTGPVFSGPDCTAWEKMLNEVFVISTTPFPDETAVFADLVLPDHTYLERLQVADTYPYQGYPISMIRTPAVKPLYDTRVFGDMLIDLGKRIKGSTGEYYKKLGNTENIIKGIASIFAEKPGDNGVNSYETWKEKGVWYQKPYHWRQIRGEFYEWDKATQSYSKPMTQEAVKVNLLKTPSGKFEFKSGYLEEEHHVHYLMEKFGLPAEMIAFPQYLPSKHGGGGDLHFVSPKLAMQAEGRGANLPHVTACVQPTQGGKRTVYLEIHPETAAKRGIKDGDRVRIKSTVGAIEVYARLYEGIRPDTVALPMIHGHWGMGRWSKNSGVSGSTNEVTPNVSDAISGQCCYHDAKVFVEKV